MGQAASACRTVQWDTAEWSLNAEAVYVVRVIAVSVPDVLDRPHQTSPNGESFITTGLNKDVDVIVYEALKGSSDSNIRATISWCGGGGFELAHKAVLFKLGNKWHIRGGLENIDIARQALTKQLN